MRGIILVEGTPYPFRPRDIETRWPPELVENSFLFMRNEPDKNLRNRVAYHLIKLCQALDSWGPFSEEQVRQAMSMPFEFAKRVLSEFAGEANNVLEGKEVRRYFLFHKFVAKCFEIRPRQDSNRLGCRPFDEIKIGTIVQSPFTGRYGRVDYKRAARTRAWPGDPENAFVGIAWDGEDGKRSDAPLCDLENIIIMCDNPDADFVPLPE